MIPFVCTLAASSPEPHLHEHIAIDWVEPARITSYDLAPADIPVVASYRGKK